MKRIIAHAALAVALLGITAGGASAQLTNFSKDVNSSIDHSLDYLRANFWNASLVPSPLQQAHGLLGLAILEKHATADFSSPILGYANSSADDQTRLRNLAKALIDDTGFGHIRRGSFYAYVDGIDMMFLSQYARTGGPDPMTATGMTVRQAMDVLVDRTLAQQTTPASGFGTVGMWGYTSPGQDSSTTQFAAGGLAAARGFYLDSGMDPGGRATLIATALASTRNDGYAPNSSENSGFPAATYGKGWGYQVPGSAPSYQQTASGMWATVLGGANVNSQEQQDGLLWQRMRYNYQNINSWGDGWQGLSYGYYLFSSSKAYSLQEDQGIAPSPGNLSTDDLGTLPADPSVGRLTHRDPAADPCALVNFPADCHGSYSSEPKRWYYDYAYTIMSRQSSNGSFAIVNGGWDNTADQGYHVLVLERSIAGACVDSDNDGVCDDQDNCPTVANPDQDPSACSRGPVCTAAAPTTSVLWQADSTMANVGITGVTDPDGDALTIVINSVRSDESSSLAPPSPDAVIKVNGTVDLRKQRGVSSKNVGNGRVYYIAFTATDPGGASCDGNVQVSVPRNLATPAVGDGPNFDATAP